MLIYMIVSGTVTTDKKDNVAINTTTKAEPIPTVFLVNIAAKIIGIKLRKSNP